jgi:hypothetical protein
VIKDLPEDSQEAASKVLNGNYFVDRFLSGGGGTMAGSKVDEQTFKALEQLAKREYFQREYNISSYIGLLELLAVRGVELSLRGGHSRPSIKDYLKIAEKAIPKKVFEITKEIYELLPKHHFGHEHFKELMLNGWGGGAAKTSEYDDPVVHMFEFTTKGAVRNYIGLLLHETGHSHLKLLEENNCKDDIYGCAKELHGSQGIKPFVIDYLYGSESRLSEIGNYLREFAAEVYLLYVARGVELKKAIPSLPEKQRKPWEKLYDIFKQSFDNIEYS